MNWKDSGFFQGKKPYSRLTPQSEETPNKQNHLIHTLQQNWHFHWFSRKSSFSLQKTYHLYSKQKTQKFYVLKLTKLSHILRKYCYIVIRKVSKSESEIGQTYWLTDCVQLCSKKNTEPPSARKNFSVLFWSNLDYLHLWGTQAAHFKELHHVSWKALFPKLWSPKYLR